MVMYLAKLTGHRCVRINNHEHTDLQEYLGSYKSDTTGRFVFQEGPLVTAARRGDWVILDELNLAPSEVLEALNRLLDDNREILIHETGEVVKPHPRFQLFAAQNPAGTYGGRKFLSQAFKNRFLILHVDDIPSQELEEILVKRTKIEPRFAKVLVKVKEELERRRQRSNVFLGKRGFITPRDMLRWANRISTELEDNDVFRFDEENNNKEKHIPESQRWACVGFSLLGERLRRQDERQNLCALLENTCRYSAKIVVDPESMYGTDVVPSPVRRYLSEKEKKKKSQIENNKRKRDDLMNTEEEEEDTSLNGMCLEGIAWTKSMRRLFRLTGDCLKHSEPALLVGATAAGKTTVCQIWAQVLGRKLHVVSCHRNTEASDIIGGLHPIRDRSGHGEELVDSVRDLLEKIRQALDSPPSKRARRVEDSSSPSESTDTDTNTTTPRKKRVLTESHELPGPLSKTEVTVEYALQVAEKCGALKRKPAGLLRDAMKCDESLVSSHQRFQIALRTYRSLFEWYDGPLVKAMKNGDIFLLVRLMFENLSLSLSLLYTPHTHTYTYTNTLNHFKIRRTKATWQATQFSSD